MRLLRQLLIFSACLSRTVTAQAITTPAPSAPPPTTTPAGVSEDDDTVCINPTTCIPRNPTLRVNRLEPPGGPLEGETKVIVYGHGYRNFGSLMRCRFGSVEVLARIYTEPQEVADPYNHTKLTCEAPASPEPIEQSVTVEVTLNGVDYSTSGKTFRYYRHPVLAAVSPDHGSAYQNQTLTLTRSTAAESGSWSPLGESSERLCKFEAVVQPTGRRQVQFTKAVNASVADVTELQCLSPSVDFVAPVKLEVSVNGQQYSSSGPLFVYEDNWHSPARSGVAPSGFHGMSSCRVGSIAYFFGGEDGLFHSSGNGYSDEFWALHLDVMHDYYPSEDSRDLAWQKLSLSSGGDPPSPRSYSSLTAWGTTLILFGGVSSAYGDMHNATFEYSTARSAWQQVAVSGGPISPRSGHTATLCSLSVGCATSDGRPRIYVFGGWGMAPCEGVRQCLKHRNDLVALDLNSMVWQPVVVNQEQPLPPKRKGHTATLINSTLMIVFGGSAWVPDPEADNSYGYSTHQVNDLWGIDLSGSDDFTWRALHSVGDRPSPREGHGASLVANRYLVVQGGYSHDKAFMNETYVLDTHQDPMLWIRPTLTGSIPNSRVGHSVMTIDHDEVLVVGGMSYGGFENDVNILQIGVGNDRLFPGVSHS